MDHRCEVWTRLGINCPGGLRPTDKERERKRKEEEEDDESEAFDELFAHKRAKQSEGKMTYAQLAQLAILLELYRRTTADSFEKERFRVPQEIVREGVRQGARGIEAALWVAAAAAVLAVGRTIGPGAAARIPTILRPTSPAGQGFFFQAPTFRTAVSRRVDEFLGSGGGGEFFPGILG